jgi:cytochrome c biogenesis protein CcdA
MAKFTYWYEGFIFILIFSVIMAIPCVAIALLGSKLISNLGQYPTRSARLQLETALPLSGVMILTFGLFILFFHIFSD